MTEPSQFTERAFETIADTEKSGGLDSQHRDAEPANFFRHALSLSLTKTADGLIDPKLVLSWLMTTLGAPAFWIGLLVPVREAGALLPQIFTAPRIHNMARRKWAWALGSAGQGVAALGIVVAGLTLTGTAAGITIVTLLAFLAVARSICSVSYKDILGKTVGKTRRGTVTGLASSISSASVILFSLLLLTGAIERLMLVMAAIALAAAFWLIAAAVFATLAEARSEEAPRQTGLAASLSQFAVLRNAPHLTHFILARGLLTGTALAPPFLVILASEAGQTAFDQLGALVLASAAAAFLSSYVWGRLSDRSSRLVLTCAGLLAALALAAAIVCHGLGLMGTVWAAPLILFVLMIAYNGVRQARSTYLVDMAPADKRAEYTAVSNTVIGVVLLGSGIFGAIAAGFGAVWTVAFFAGMSVVGAFAAYRLAEVQRD